MNVLVVVCDALHKGFVGCYGNEWVQTPRLDRLANNGFVFDRCYPNDPSPGGWARTGWTGLWQPATAISSDAKTQPELFGLLENRGVRIFHSTPFENSTSSFLGRWFKGKSRRLPTPNEVREHPEYRVPETDLPGMETWIARWARQIAEESAAITPSIERQMEQVVAWVSKSRGTDGMLVWLEAELSCLDPHGTPWTVPAEFQEQYLDEETPVAVRDPMHGFLGESLQEADLLAAQIGYAARISYFDELLGSLLDELDQPGEPWLVIVTADQGFPLGEHSVIGNHRPWLYEERAHVPLIVFDPAGRPSRRSPTHVQSVDLYSTLLEYFGQDSPNESLGRSWMPMLRGEIDSRRDYLCAGLEDAEYCIRTNHWTLLLPVRFPDDPPRRRELYGKPEDCWDTNNIEELNRDAANLLELQLRRHLDAISRGALDQVPPIEELSLIAQSG